MIVLASSSPYRKQLLQQLRIPFVSHAPDIDETPLPDESAQHLVQRLSRAKAQAVAQRLHHQPEAVIIASDQVGELNGSILGKPHDKQHAVRQLSQAIGQKVVFVTGLTVMQGQVERTSLHTVDVCFRRDLSDREIDNYINKQQPLQCCAAFQSEGLGVTLVDAIHSDDPHTIIGLPLIQLCRDLRNFGIKL